MDQLIEDYLRDCQSRGMAVGSMPRYRSVLRIYQRYLVQSKADILAVDNAVLIGFLDHLRARKARDKTLKNYFSALSSF